ncbi:coiled-coil domain-containing protein 97 [Galleria mellonella]|uniref:Coiled-coil domain-containing protein 97 n=1 Tax=Galleria mellonella TaxID=7137 RepID=A0A6J1WFM9_GALME|nr:coiled-coil domain-containing protein 97 [Galleria mellonella]
MENNCLTDNSDMESNFDPIHDIIDYLVRCAKISFKNARIDETEVRTTDKVRMAYDLYQRSPTDFLIQFGKYLAPYHIGYFETLNPVSEKERFQECVTQLKHYHSEESRHKRIRNRRYKALQKLQDESDYFSEKQMMYRNPLLYEQLIGQYLTDEEIQERDGVDNENLTFLNMILETVDRNQMRETKNEQMLTEIIHDGSNLGKSDKKDNNIKQKGQKKWGDFDTPDTKPSFVPETRKQAMISSPERNLLREEFFQEMYSSFIEGSDTDIDYSTIDNDEQYDDLQQLSQDAEDRYFDSELNDVENLEEHMKLVEQYGKKSNKTNECALDDSLDIFMKHISNKLNVS